MIPATTTRLRTMAHNASRKAHKEGMQQHWREFGQHMHPQECAGKRMSKVPRIYRVVKR